MKSLEHQGTSRCCFPRSDVVIYYKKYVFGLSPISCHGAPKTLGICFEEKDKGIFCYVREASFQKHLGCGLINNETNLVITGLELSVPPTDLQRRERSWRLSSEQTVNDLNNHTDAIVSINLKGYGVWRISGLMDT